MTDHDAVYGNDGVLGPWLDGQQSLLLDELGDVLDVEAGLREVLLQSSHDTMVNRLDAVLDVEAGLAAVLPGTGPTEQWPEPAVSLPQAPTMEQLLSRVSPRVRIALRVHPDVVAGCEALETLETAAPGWRDIQPYVRLLDDALSGREADYEAARHFSGKLDRAAERLCHVLEEVKGFLRHGFVESLDEVLLEIRHISRKLADASALAGELASRRGADGGSGIRRAQARRAAREAAEHLSEAVNRARRLVDDLGDLVQRGDWAVRHLSAEGPEHMRKVLARRSGLQNFPTLEFAEVRTFLDDFTAADLRTAVLADIDLAGVRWSTATTRWPEAMDVEDLKARSEEIPPGSGIFTVRSGTATIRESVDA
ncbi:hypothetical protein ACWD4T_11470 [Streptomyces umbrinus]